MSYVWLDLIVLVALIGLSSLFSATETAYTGLTILHLKRSNKLFPGALSLWEKEPHRVLAALLLSNNAVASGAGVIAAALASALAHKLGWRSSILVLVFGFLVSCAILVFGEILPKVLAQRFTIGWALFITPFMRRWTAWVSPFARAAAWLANALLLGRARRSPSPFLNKSALRRILTHARLPTSSHKLINNVMEFGRLTAKDVAKPRSDVFYVPLNLSLEKLMQSVIQSGYSRVPVVNNGLDDLVGLLLAKDLLVAWRSGTLVVFQDLLRPIIQVPPDMPLPELLRIFRVRRQHLAVLRNTSNGRVEGVATLQDAVAALVGPIKEEN